MSGTDKPGSGKTGMRRGVRILLVMSLGLNLLLVGLVVGSVASHRFGDGAHHPPRLETVGGPLSRALSHEDRRAIGAELRKAYRAGRPSQADRQAEFDAIFEALRAQPYDAARLHSQIAQQTEGLHQRLVLGQDALLQRIDSMSDAERADYADRLRAVLERPRPPGGKSHNRHAHW